MSLTNLVFGDAIVAQLNANPDIAALLPSNQPSIFAGYVPNQVPPSGVWVSFFRISGARVAGHDGDEGLAHPRYQFTIGSSTSLALAQALRDVLVTEFNGVTLTYTDANGNVYKLTWLLSEAGDHEIFDEPLRAWKCVVDFFIWSNTTPNV
jgi:hypothetical protein